MSPLSVGSFSLREAKEEVENLRLRATKTVPVFEDGEWETSAAPHMPCKSEFLEDDFGMNQM